MRSLYSTQGGIQDTFSHTHRHRDVMLGAPAECEGQQPSRLAVSGLSSLLFPSGYGRFSLRVEIDAPDSGVIACVLEPNRQ
jgi:hypothetical protein